MALGLALSFPGSFTSSTPSLMADIDLPGIDIARQAEAATEGAVGAHRLSPLRSDTSCQYCHAVFQAVMAISGIDK